MEGYHSVKLIGFSGGKDYIMNFPGMRQTYLEGGPDAKRIIREAIDPLAIEIGRYMIINGDIDYLTRIGFLEPCNADGSKLNPKEKSDDAKQLSESVKNYRDAIRQLRRLKKEILAIEEHVVVV